MSDSAYRINVVKTKQLISACADSGIVPVYFSTDNVFDGVKGNYDEKDSTNPLNLYGRIKCEMESYLYGLNAPFLLLRFGKTFDVVRGDPTLYSNMKPGDRLKLATDQIFTPLYIDELFGFIQKCIAENITGLYHLASTFPVNRFEIAKKAKKFFGICNVDLTSCSIDELGLVEKRPKNIDLNVIQYQNVSGKGQRDIEYFLRMIK